MGTQFFLISTTYKGTNLAGKLDLIRTYQSIQRPKIICSPLPLPPQNPTPARIDLASQYQTGIVFMR
jgi:hypothetical protein